MRVSLTKLTDDRHRLRIVHDDGEIAPAWWTADYAAAPGRG